MEKLAELYKEILETKSLIKIVFSRPENKDEIKTVGRFVVIKGERMLQTEKLQKDGKAIHRNVKEADATDELLALSASHRQINLMTTGGNCEILVSKNKKVHINSAVRMPLTAAEAQQNDRAHSFLLDPVRAAPFLSKLGICSESGEIYDRGRSKFRQINRFVEIVDDVYRFLPQEGPLTVLDLCCGKSYLTFAVYYYLTAVKNRTVTVCGVDLKKDVIDFCGALAKELGFDGMCFSCMNIFDFVPPAQPDLVVSLHACDTATDIVLYNAVKFGARAILSTPCCHHEMNRQLSCPELSFVNSPMYRQKMCDAFTDALRCKRLEAVGYKVTALELIDPEETPKNILIKAVRARVPEEKRARALEEYRRAAAFLGVDPYLDKLFEEKK